LLSVHRLFTIATTRSSDGVVTDVTEYDGRGACGSILGMRSITAIRGGRSRNRGHRWNQKGQIRQSIGSSQPIARNEDIIEESIFSARSSGARHMPGWRCRSLYATKHVDDSWILAQVSWVDQRSSWKSGCLLLCVQTSDGETFLSRQAMRCLQT